MPRFKADRFDADGLFFVFDKEKGGSEHMGPFRTFEAAEESEKELNEMVAERARLWAQMQEQGGRGVDIAERIDEIDKLLAETPQERRMRVASEIIEEADSGIEWGQSSAEDLARFKYAVVVQDSSRQTWVEGADSDDDIAGIDLNCTLTDSDETEWIESITDLDTGEQYTAPGAQFVLEVRGEGTARHRTGNLTTPNGFDRLWIEAINVVLEDRESTLTDAGGTPTAGMRLVDLDQDLWDRFIGPLCDHIEREEPEGLVRAVTEKEEKS